MDKEFIRNIAEKEIAIGVDVPYSREVDYITFSRVLKDDRVVASYKMYWLLAILDEVQEGNIEIEFRKLITRMIDYAWYYTELGLVVFIYGINYILFLLILMNKKIFYKLYRVIKSRNISIIFLVLLTVLLDLLLSFDKIVNWSDDPMYRGYVFTIIVLAFVGATLYFASIEKRSREIRNLNDALEERIKELNKIKHDYGAQISYLYGLHLMKRYERVGELLKDIINGHNSIDTAIEVSNNSDSVIAIITKGIRHTGIKVILDEHADLNDIEMTEFELQKVLSNIISNAVTAMDGQGILAIRTFEKFNDIVICIQNNGPMIEDEVIDKIFQSGFSTKDNSNKEHGFGLAIVKETIEKCKGKISVTSDIEKTEFIITIPRKDK